MCNEYYEKTLELFHDRTPRDASLESLVIFLYQECSTLLEHREVQKERINRLEKALKDRVDYLETCNTTLASQRNKALRELRILLDAYHKVVSEKEPESADIDNICQ